MSHKKLIQVIGMLLPVFVICSIPLTSYATGFSFSFNSTDLSSLFGTSSATSSPENIVASIVAVILSFVGLIFLVLVIYAGFILAFSGGNEQNVTKARGIIFTAVIGLIITLASYGIAFFVFSKLSGNPTVGSCTEIGGICTTEACPIGKGSSQLDCPSGQKCCYSTN